MRKITSFCENTFIASWIQIRFSLKFRFNHLIAFAVSFDRDGVKFGFGDDGDLSVEVDAEILG